MKLIDKEILLLKIDSKIEEAQKVFNVAPSSVIGGMIEGYTRTKKIISSLEVKEVCLEEELNIYLEKVKETDEDIVFKDFARHFFELGLKTQKGESV